MSDNWFYKFDTLALHAGQHPDPATGARATPIYQTTAYVFPSPDHAASIFNIERTRHVYSRISNLTDAVLEERISVGIEDPDDLVADLDRALTASQRV